MAGGTGTATKEQPQPRLDSCASAKGRQTYISVVSMCETNSTMSVLINLVYEYKLNPKTTNL